MSASIGTTVPKEFEVRNLLSDDYDIYTTLYYMAFKPHSGVRDYLIHSLYDKEYGDIEKILPQLCHLYMLWAPSECSALGDYFIHLASSSIHFTLKLIFTLRAQIHNCAHKPQVEAMVSSTHMLTVPCACLYRLH